MKEIKLSFIPAAEDTFKKGTWILIILCEVLVGFVGAVLDPLYIPILLVGTFCVIYSIKRPYFSYVLLLFSLPLFEYSIMGTQDVKHQAELKFSDILVVLTIFVWLLDGLVRKNLSFAKSPIITVIILLFAFMFLSLVWCKNLPTGCIVLAKKIVSVTVLFLTVNLVTDRKRLDSTLKFWTIIGSVYAFYGLWEMTHKHFTDVNSRFDAIQTSIRTSATEAGPNEFGFYLNLCLMICIPQVIITKSLRYRIFLIFSITMMILALITTISRGSWIGFAAGTIILSAYSKKCRKILLIGIVVAVVFLVSICNTYFMDAIYGRFTGLMNPSDTRDFEGRSSVWAAGFRMFQGSPICGVGIGSFGILSHPLGTQILILPHNLYVYILSEFGLIGISIFLSLVAVFIYNGIKTLKMQTGQDEKLILIGLFAGLFIYCLQGMTGSFYLEESEMWAFFGLAIAAINVLSTRPSVTPTSSHSLETSK